MILLRILQQFPLSLGIKFTILTISFKVKQGKHPAPLGPFLLPLSFSLTVSITLTSLFFLNCTKPVGSRIFFHSVSVQLASSLFMPPSNGYLLKTAALEHSTKQQLSILQPNISALLTMFNIFQQFTYLSFASFHCNESSIKVTAVLFIMTSPAIRITPGRK